MVRMKSKSDMNSNMVSLSSFLLPHPDHPCIQNHFILPKLTFKSWSIWSSTFVLCYEKTFRSLHLDKLGRHVHYNNIIIVSSDIMILSKFITHLHALNDIITQHLSKFISISWLIFSIPQHQSLQSAIYVSHLYTV